MCSGDLWRGVFSATAAKGGVVAAISISARGVAESNTGDGIKAPFGTVNRQRLIGEFLAIAKGQLPWMSVYKLLLWTDTTTGLAHCYESDKCQPGKPWHPRSLRFHSWLAESLEIEPRRLSEQIDWLFRKTAADYASYMIKQHQILVRRAASQRAPFEGLGMPIPGEDPAIVAIIREVLGDRLSREPTLDEWQQMTSRIRELIAVENKRKNLVGEGFEDVLAAVTRAFDEGGLLDVRVRPLLQDIPGFANIRLGDKANRVDVAVVRKADGQRTIVTAKWSIRADREKQFPAEFASYVTAKSDMQPFDYVLLTNEFDPARLVRACQMTTSNAFMFSTVVHVNPEALRAVYGSNPEPTMQKVLSYISSGRLRGFDNWLNGLTKSQ